MARARIQAYLDIAPKLRCPLCSAPLHAEQASLACDRGHRFDISAKGFLTLVPNVSPLKGYDAAFFESRARIMASGLYDDVLTHIVSALSHLPAASFIMDAGCGEGHYAKAIQQQLGHNVIGIDHSKDAIRIAARGGNPVRWLVADLAHMPLVNDSVHGIVNVFTPANYNEFARVLVPGGMLLKVVPGSRHMEELRALAGKDAASPYSNDAIVAHLEHHAKLIGRERVTTTMALDESHAADVIRMSPVTFALDKDALDASRLTSITVDAEILVAAF